MIPFIVMPFITKENECDFRPRVEKGNAIKLARARAGLRSMFTIYRRMASHVDMKNTAI